MRQSMRLRTTGNVSRRQTPFCAVFLGWFLALAALGEAQNEPWQLVPLSELNSSDDEVLIGWDGETLYFSRSDRARSSKGTSAWFKEDKTDWESTRLQGWSGFASPEPVILRAFASAEWPGFDAIQHVAIDAERGVLVMSASAKEGGDFDLFMAQEMPSGWGMPIPLQALNTTGDEVYPNFQNGTLLFASDGRDEGLGGFDVFQSQRLDNYNSVKPLPAPLNSKGDELAVLPAGDSKNAGFYLSAARFGSDGMDLWWTGPPLDTPESLTEFALEFRHQRQPMRGLKVVIQERGGGPHIFSGSSDGAGRVRIGNVKLDAAMTVQVFSELQGVSIPDGAVCHVFERNDEQRGSDAYWPGWERIRSYRMEAGTAFVFDLLPLDALGRWQRPHDGDASRLNQEAVVWTGRFEKSRFQLAENDRLELLKWLNGAKTGSGEWPEWKLEVVGYADASGSMEHNEALSKLRAEHAKTVALATGMDPNRIVCEGKGSLGSFGASKSDRRVELRWVPLQ